MNAKLILAEGLDVLRKGEGKELEADKLQEAIMKSSKLRRQLPRLKAAYSHAYDTFIRGLEMVNFVRRTAIAVGEHDLVRFCEIRMTHYMDRCENLRNKEANILLPIQLMGTTLTGIKEGYEVKATIASLNYSSGIDKNTPWKVSEDVVDGSYLIRVRNMDDYAIAAPAVVVEVGVLGIKNPIQVHKAVPCQCGWVRVIGVVGKGLLNVRVSCDAVLRKSHVEVEILRLEEISKTDWMQSLPRIDDIIDSSSPHGAGQPSPAQDPRGLSGEQQVQLPTFVPPEPIIYVYVKPPGVNLMTRLGQVQRKLNSFPSAGVAATKLDKNEQFVLQAIHKLPIPTDICGDMGDLDGRAFDVTGGELENHR